MAAQTHNRIDNCFARLRAAKRKGFIPYICAGDPSLEHTFDFALALEKSGADILELGLPFSDPLADGIVNQLAAQRALAAGATPRGVLECISKIRKQSQIPIVLYSYLNPIFQFGPEKFYREAEAAGVDGLLILDLPPEEDAAGALDCLKQSNWKAETPPDIDCLKQSRKTGDSRENLFHIRLIAPTTPLDRIAMVAKNARGFLYYVSREGVTGAREDISASLAARLNEIRKISDLPIAVGFGISNAKQAREVARHADAVVVGSAIVDLIAKHGDKTVEKVAALAQELANAIKSA